jgi:hypothetical protein
MGIKYYLKTPVSEYTDQQGQQKKRYQTVGIVTETAKGDLMFKIEMLPFLGLKEGAIWGYLNPPEDKAKQVPESAPAPDNSIPDDDIPF